MALLKEGVRDGAVARAVQDALFAFRHGQVSATLDIVSADLRSGTVVLVRNAETPALIGRGGRWDAVAPGSGPVGRYPLARPDVRQLPAEPGLRVAIVSDGIAEAGLRAGGGRFDLPAFAARFGPRPAPTLLADEILAEAIRRDGNRPADDMTVAVLAIDAHDEPMLVRRMSVTMPLSGFPTRDSAADEGGRR